MSIPLVADLQPSITSGGLLLEGDPWRDWGLLGVPDPNQQEAATATPSFRSFIETAYPGYGFHR